MNAISRFWRKNQKNIGNITFLLIFFLFILLRFYNLDKRIIFDWDQEHYAYEIKNLVENHKLTLIGPRANNDLGFFLGPYFTYIMTPFYLLSGLHPYGSVLFIICFNFCFFFLSYKLLSEIFDKMTARLFLLFWSINSLLVVYDTIPWWPIFIPLGSVIVTYLLIQIEKKNSLSLWLLLGISLGFFTNMHFQFIFIILFSLIFLIINAIKKKMFSFKQWLGLGISFALMFSPLALFDLRHDFLNSKLFFNFFVNNNDKIKPYFLNWSPVFTNLIKPLIYVNSYGLMFVFIGFFLVLISLIYHKTKLKTFYLSLGLLWIIMHIVFCLYGKRPSEYYYVFIYPFIYITICQTLNIIKNRSTRIFTIVIIIFLFVLINLKINLTNLYTNNFGLYYKDMAIKEIKKIASKNPNISVTLDTPLGANFGYFYLMDYYRIKRTGNPTDPLIQIRIPPKKGDMVINQLGLHIPKELQRK